MSAPAPRQDQAPVCDAWTELEALAVAMRSGDKDRGWSEAAVQAAVIAAKAAWPFEKAAVELWRLIWAADGTPAELVSTIRAERPRRAGQLDPAARARVLEDMRHSTTNRHGDNYQDARRTGPIPVIPPTQATNH